METLGLVCFYVLIAFFALLVWRFWMSFLKKHVPQTESFNTLSTSALLSTCLHAGFVVTFVSDMLVACHADETKHHKVALAGWAGIALLNCFLVVAMLAWITCACGARATKPKNKPLSL
jgi:hypothetical protein